MSAAPPATPLAPRRPAPRLAALAAALAAGVASLPGPAAAQAHHPGAAPPAAPAGGEDAPLATAPTLEAVLGRVMARNPGLAEARARVDAARARRAAAGRLPEPELQAELREVPLSRPFDVAHADMVMLGLRQALPAPGARGARIRAADASAASGRDAVAARRQELENEVRRAFAAFAHAWREEDIHHQHMDLNQQIVTLARGRFEAGRLSKRELLRTTFELSRLHADLVNVEAMAGSARARLNALMARPAAAPLGQPVETRRPEPPDLGAMRARLEDRPDVAAARSAVAEAEARLEAARREAGWPGFMVGADYAYRPMDGAHVYNAMVGVTLPWLWGGRGDAVQEAAAEAEAARRALEGTRTQADLELADAAARLEAAGGAFQVLDQELVPQARRQAEEARAEFITGQGEADMALEALHAYLTVRLQRSRALQLLEEAEADLDRAAGIPYPAAPPAGATR